MQIHDFNPGIEPNGLFWTSPIRNRDASIKLGNGRADVHVRDLPVPDFFNIENALFPTFEPIPGIVSFRGHWTSSHDRHHFDYQDPVNPDEKWRGTFVFNELRTEWKGETELAKYTSGPMSESNSLFAEVGFERNGEFYSSGPEGDGEDAFDV